MGPSAAPTAMKERRDAVEAAAAVVLPGQCGAGGGERRQSSELGPWGGRGGPGVREGGEGSCGGLSPALWERLGGTGGAQPEERSCMRAAGGRGAVRVSHL